jgi:Spy/CpxP family protein refolding chaperone
MDRHEARGGGDGVAVMMAFEQACLGEGVGWPSTVEHKAAPLGRGAYKLQCALANEDKAEGRIAHPEQHLTTGQAPVATGRQGLKKIGIHVTAIIGDASGSALPASTMTSTAALTIAALSLVLALPASAQHAGPHGHHHQGPGQDGTPSQPYAGLEGRRIKALSEADAAALLAGRGMGLALAAELNGYPGPMHVLELVDALRLTSAQQIVAESLRDRMAGEACSLGARIVALEGELDRLFATGTAETGGLSALTASIGALNGRLREVHLATHIAMRDALEPEQRAAYARLRGYTAER